MDGIKLVSLNIEADKHLERVKAFLKNEDADIVCLQEVLSNDVEDLKNLLNMDGRYGPTVFIRNKNEMGFTPGNQWGVMVLCKIKPVNFKTYYYVGNPYELPEFKDNYHNSDCRVVVVAEFEKKGKKYTIATTHFTWSKEGETTDFQLEHLEKLLTVLKNYKCVVLCGDFNAPRGKKIWSKLASLYRDNIPREITTTIDQNLHRKKGIQLVVDGMFSTPEFEVGNVVVQSGVSDHMALIASLTSEISS